MKKNKVIEKIEALNKIKALPKTVQQSIPYKQVFENGIIETRQGVFTKAYKLPEINFQLASNKTQEELFIKYMAFLNSFDGETQFQIVIDNHFVEKGTVFDKIRLNPQQDGLNKYRQEMNSIVIENLAKGKSSIEQDKYLIVTCKGNNFEEINKKFNSIDIEISKNLGTLIDDLQAEDIEPMTLNERLQHLYKIYNQDDYAEEYVNKGEVFNLKQLASQGLTTKDIVAPSGMNFQKSRIFELGNVYGTSLSVQAIPNLLDTNFITEIADTTCSSLISMHFEPTDSTEAIKFVKERFSSIEAQVAEKENQARDNGRSVYIPPELKKAYENAEELMNDLMSRNQKLFYVTIVVTLFSDREDILNQNAEYIKKIGSKKLVRIKPLTNQMEFGLNASLPLGINELFTDIQCTTESASVFIPFTSMEIQQKNAIFYGLNSSSHNMILCNRLDGNNYNGLIFGKPGTGKSFTTKIEMVSVLLNMPNTQVIVIDPQGEYYPLAENLHGKVLDISPTSSTYINPLDLDLESDSQDPVTEKADYIINMIEIMTGRGRELSSIAQTIIDRCIHRIYQPYVEALNEKGQTFDASIVPTLNDLYNELLRQDEYEAGQLAGELERFVMGSYKMFSHRTNYDIRNERFVVYNTKRIGTGMMELGYHVCLNDSLNRMIHNSRKNVYTWIYIDEFHMLLNHDSTTKFLTKLWKIARKWNGVLTGIMQTTNDLLRSADTRAIFDLTSFMIILSEEKNDRDNLQALLNLSNEQLKYITNNKRGAGILYNGRMILPFEYDFPKDTELYKLMTTSHDVEGARFA